MEHSDEYEFDSNVVGKVIIKNDATEQTYNFNVQVCKISIYKLNFSFIDKTFALVMSKCDENEQHLSGLLSFFYEQQHYTFDLDIENYTVDITPDRQFELQIVGAVVNHEPELDDEDVFVNNFKLNIDGLDETSVLCGYNELLDIMTNMAFKNIFTGFLNKRIDCALFETEILDLLDEVQKKIVLSVYHKDYRHNEYRILEDTKCEDRAKVLEIVRNLG